MMEPTREQLERGAGALSPFVKEWEPPEAGHGPERYLEPNTRSYRAVSPAFWNLTSLPSR